MATIEVDRTQVMAYRVAAHELYEEPAGEPAVLDLGVQDTPPGTAAVGLAARRWTPPDDGSTVMIWSTRGAPHLHRRADLPALAAALWPLSDADAAARMRSAPLKAAAGMGLTAFRSAAQVMREVVTRPMTKGEVSRAVSDGVPPELTYWCPTCQAQHISGLLFQQVGLPAGVQLLPGGRPTMLAPVEGTPGVPAQAAGTGDLIGAYLRLLGPAAPVDVARFLGTTATAIRPAWPDGLQEVRVDGRPRFLPADRAEALLAAPPPRGVRLLAANDPFLQPRDRDLLVPDRARQKEVWRAISSPGVVLADGEVTATWRARTAGRRLEVTVTPFEPVPPGIRAGLEEEGARLAAVRGAADVRVLWTEDL
ncbi:Winged helix DNA-binding domain-containing protein [Thermomonospora echinospora]|uniref:Winged helix DNA-binding domain-containing protein n=1 Tax=Thermomonospora echinospora TaxID=1992 RepID=A0A1H5X050_9ACTN|nr:crosslink repair DNA glycosylase YcaQ family protein [Thermomonospora echinospora]SEG04923.1 Winged helix DNA-binding domain-containing protein [Thermomonospora echinospora]